MADVEGDTEVVLGEEQQQEGESTEQVEQPEQPQEQPDEVVVTIGEEEPPPSEEQAAPEWVRELRKENREKGRRIRELETQLGGQSQPKNIVGAKPTLEGCDYDAEKFEADLTAWHERKRTADAEERKRTEAAEAGQKAWQAKLENYGTLKSALKVSDYDDAEAAVQGSLTQIQQAVILNGADNPALLVYALGKNPKKAKELASITDPVRFAFAVAKLETQLKVQPRKSAPPPETVVRGSGALTQPSSKQLEKLEEEADRTGDRTKVIAFKRQLREQAS